MADNEEKAERRYGKKKKKEDVDKAFDPDGMNERGQAAIKHMEDNKIKAGEVFEHGGESWVGGDGVVEQASEKQIIDHSNKKLRENRK